MNWLREHAGELTLVAKLLGALGVISAGLWYAFSEYSSLAKKSEVESLERVLKSGLLELAECVDNPQYLVESDPPQPKHECEIRIYRTIEEEEKP